MTPPHGSSRGATRFASRHFFSRSHGTALWFQVDDVDKIFTDWSARGVAFTHGPRKVFWGYGAELQDPDGYIVRLWDQRSMAEK